MGFASFVASLFAGLFVGTLLLQPHGRPLRPPRDLQLFAAVVFRGHVHHGLSIDRRLPSTSGASSPASELDVEFVTIDAYISELVPKHTRGRAFAFNQFLSFLAVPFVAFVSWLLVPRHLLGLDGWRWVVIIGALGAIFVWFIRSGIPESPRWLEQHGRAGRSRPRHARDRRACAPRNR